MASHVPTMAPDEGVIDAAKAVLGEALIEAREAVGEVTLIVARDSIATVLQALRDTPGLEYQQLMEIAGVDYPERSERFEVVYHLLSLTRNRRIRVKLSTDEATAVPSVTALWPVAGWLEREVFDMYGVAFAGNSDLRRILTDYGFEGHPQRKDFPLTGFVELRYSEAEKRVVYEPVALPQDFRNFDFLMPWEGAEYRLPGDEKAESQQPGAPSPAAAPTGPPKVESKTDATTPKTTETTADTGGGAPANAVAKKDARKTSKAKAEEQVSKDSDIPDPKPKGAGRRRPGGGAG
ncbi:MAG TPA: NADH-quinone oxidoreductase subunit C [Sphingomicrobium sp.]|nr:NADH-quinone oxidoreductase subunit C [Sphingomicrobium sp.]